MNSLLDHPNSASTSTSPVEVTYGEALRVFWRLYWLALICSFAVLVFWTVLWVSLVGPLQATVLVALSLVPLAGFVLLFLPRILRPFRGFRLLLVGNDDAQVSLSGGIQVRLAGFVLSRLILVGAGVGFMLIPLNIFFGLFRINVSAVLQLGSIVFIVGPYAMKMMVSHPFRDFRIEVKRP